MIQIRNALAILLALVALLATPPAQAALFTTSSPPTIVGMGDEINSGYDKFSLAGGTGTAIGLQAIGLLTFDAGNGNCVLCTLTPSGTMAFDLDVGGDTVSHLLGLGWSSTGASDLLALTEPTPYLYPSGIMVTFMPLATMVVTGQNPVVTASFMAEFTEVPEPATLGLLAFGLAGLTMVRQRNKT